MGGTLDVGRERARYDVNVDNFVALASITRDELDNLRSKVIAMPGFCSG